MDELVPHALLRYGLHVFLDVVVGSKVRFQSHVLLTTVCIVDHLVDVVIPCPPAGSVRCWME